MTPRLLIGHYEYAAQVGHRLLATNPYAAWLALEYAATGLSKKEAQYSVRGLAGTALGRVVLSCHAARRFDDAGFWRTHLLAANEQLQADLMAWQPATPDEHGVWAGLIAVGWPTTSEDDTVHVKPVLHGVIDRMTQGGAGDTPLVCVLQLHRANLLLAEGLRLIGDDLPAVLALPPFERVERYLEPVVERAPQFAQYAVAMGKILSARLVRVLRAYCAVMEEEGSDEVVVAYASAPLPLLREWPGVPPERVARLRSAWEDTRAMLDCLAVSVSCAPRDSAHLRSQLFEYLAEIAVTIPVVDPLPFFKRAFDEIATLLQNGQSTFDIALARCWMVAIRVRMGAPSAEVELLWQLAREAVQVSGDDRLQGLVAAMAGVHSLSLDQLSGRALFDLCLRRSG